MQSAANFPEEVRQELGFLIADHGFHATEETPNVVRWESPLLGLEAVWDPRGEVSVTLFLRELGEPPRGWWSNGMVGKASVCRLLQMAAENMRADPAVLGADSAFYRELAEQRRRDAEEWTAFYSGKGPRPRTGSLP